jgi:iron complex outermembrane receptor protein
MTGMATGISIARSSVSMTTGGITNGEVYSLRENFYHKPVFNLNWDWNIGPMSSLSTVLYASTGQGGGTGGYGRGYYLYDADGQLDFDQIEEQQPAPS